MKAKDIIKILNNAIPKKDSWITESYGAGYLVKPLAEVEKILFCVTATPEVVEHFKKNKYDLLISHHPFTVPVPQLMYHTALDCCKGGLNDQWRDFIGIKDAKHFDQNLGWYGQIEPIAFQELIKKIETWIDHKIMGVSFSKKEIINSVCICTGLGGLVLSRAEQTGVDCYILGELTYPVEPNTSRFKSILEIGHTLTENKTGYNLLRSLLPDSVQIELAPLGIDYFGHETCLGWPVKNKLDIFEDVYDVEYLVGG